MTTVIGTTIIGSIAVLAVVGVGGATATWRRRRWTPGTALSTFLFADLVGYTSLTEAHGDEMAARVACEFQRAIAALSRGHGARHVKSMGDGVMIWTPDPDAAVALAARVVDEVGRRGDLLPVRVGVHTGSAIELDGDWYGSAVNIAARLTGAARPNEALVSAATSAAVSCEVRRLGSRRELVLHGVSRPVRASALALSDF
jgi:class 3 adenylate cyclase